MSGPRLHSTQMKMQSEVGGPSQSMATHTHLNLFCCILSSHRTLLMSHACVDLLRQV